MKLKIGLPLTQMLLALALLRWDDAWIRVADRVCLQGHRPSPASDLLDSINMPAELTRVWYPYSDLPFLWFRVVLIAGIGLFWFWVSLNIQSWRQRRAVLMFSRRWLRVGADLLLMLAGLQWGLYGLGKVWWDAEVWRHGELCFSWFLTTTPGGNVRANIWYYLPESLAACINLAWASVLIFFFARDLYFGSKARSTTSSIVFT